MRTNSHPSYLRVSLLSACNLRCSYCLPPGKQRPTITAPEGELRTALCFLYRCGVRKIRFTGGEPTMYEGLAEHVSFTKSIDGDIHAAVTSNGVLLNNMAEDLAAAGLDSLNISLDTLVPAKFTALTGRNCLHRVIEGIEAAVECIDNVKLNTVLMRGVNDDEVEQLIVFGAKRGLDIRFIEFMPNRYSSPRDSRFISNEDIRNRLPWNLQALPIDPSGAARYFKAPELNNRIGFISPVSHPFCTGCNRIRLAADGMLYACLYDSSHIDLFGLLALSPEGAESELNKLLKSKQYGRYRSTIHSAASLPSFSAIGG